ncbi:MAG: Maf family nucleotide pyrophosphatase [Burkholderiaceae bacterium]|nr:Maf family nucleotide pyrophosphatase [Burkholderiaceae bacterium]
MWIDSNLNLILASASPRRRQLLEQIQVPVEQLVVPTEGEDEPRLPKETVTDYVTRTAHDKLIRTANHWHEQHPNQTMPPMLAADTTVAIGQTILGKPQDEADARRILTALAGKTHDVYTAVAMVHQGHEHKTVVHSTVEIDGALIDAIDDYIASGEPFGKAGAYGIQGIAAAYIKGLAGSYSSVVGLPLYETAQLLRQAGLYR